MSGCEHIRSISAYHDGELPPDDARRLEAHLAQCAACAQELKELRGLSRALKNAPLPDAPPGVVERLRAPAAAAREAAVITLAKRLIAAAAAILILCAAWLWGIFDQGKPSATTAAAWERRAVTLRDETSSDTQRVAQWIVDSLSLENRHDED